MREPLKITAHNRLNDIASARSRQMSLVRGADTKPEMKVRRSAHKAGYRYQLHRRDLPGTPDMIFPSRRAVVFVHGCFWHRHSDPACKLARLPKTRLDFWLPKLTRNAERDAQSIARLEAAGWRVLVIWECETKDMDLVGAKIADHLGPRSRERKTSDLPGPRPQ